MKIVCGQDVDGASHHHLQGLKGGDDHGHHVGHLDPAGPDPVVGVHQGVHGVVHHHEPPAGRGEADIGVPGEPEHGHVMVPVEEDQLLLPENNEHCVHKLWQLKGIFGLKRNENSRTLLKTNSQVQRAVTWSASRKLQWNNHLSFESLLDEMITLCHRLCGRAHAGPAQ